MKSPQHNIPTNIITGFLGTGKTTSILHLLKQNTSGEKWAVLVNEFGEVGIDGALLAPDAFAVKEVPGGCMCCAAGLPTKIALNKLIVEARPHRILIEPTGLAHPTNIIAMLEGEDFSDVLDLRATLTLVDPRVLTDSRYTANENFIGQMQAADVLVATKTDLCSPQQLQDFIEWAARVRPDARVEHIDHGAINRDWLDLPRRASTGVSSHGPAAGSAASLLTLTPQFAHAKLAPGQSFLRKENSSGGFFSCGWIFAADTSFDFDKLFQLLNNLDILRAKAVMKTQRGTFAFNLADSALSVTEMPDMNDSRIEFIAPDKIDWNLLENWLLQARAD
ncbi:MAG: GTP-binding protein [Gammaproteobacteria bacterium]|nr:GTP-binding protein [Gammaproteobacteria bacterium]